MQAERKLHYHTRRYTIKDHHRVCSRHFPHGDPKNKPSISLGKCFPSPKKSWTSRAKRAKIREAERSLLVESSLSNSQHSMIISSSKQDMPSTAQESEKAMPVLVTAMHSTLLQLLMLANKGSIYIYYWNSTLFDSATNFKASMYLSYAV